LVYHPQTGMRVGLGSSLIYVLNPPSVAGLNYPRYSAGEALGLGTVYNVGLVMMLSVSTLLNFLLMPAMLLWTVVWAILTWPLWWAVKTTFKLKTDPVLVDGEFVNPGTVTAYALPAQAAIWVISLPIKVVNVAVVLGASSFGPKSMFGPQV